MWSPSVLHLKQPGYPEDRELNHLPSVAYFPKEKGQDPVVGLWAKENGMRRDPLRCVRAAKRLMGQGWELREVGQTPAQVSAQYLKEALGQALKDHKLDELTVTVPATESLLPSTPWASTMISCLPSR